MTKNLKENISL